MTKKEVKKPFDGDVTFVCPKCHRPVTWTEVKFTNGLSMTCMDWECKHCGADVLQLSANRRGYMAE